MSIPRWAANTEYVTGAFVLPKSSAVVIHRQPDDPSFEDATLSHWAITYENGTAGPGVVSSGAQFYDGTLSVYWAGNAGSGFKSSVSAVLTNTFAAPVKPGLKINFSVFLWRETNPSASSACDGSAGVQFYDSGMTPIGGKNLTYEPGGISAGGWSKRVGSAVAPAGAAFACAIVYLVGNTSGAKIYADLYTWDYAYQGIPNGFVFVAVQPAPGLSAKSEPVWPTSLGVTVIDNQVVWQAQQATRLIWSAIPILESGAVEPTWPTEVRSYVIDSPGVSAISWVATDGRIEDVNCPHANTAAISAEKVFVPAGDIIAFSATTNPLDWSTQGDAGYLPFGIQTYGNEPCVTLALYRANLVAFNSLGYQMWQIDPNPDNMALLDAQPIGCIYPKSPMPVNADLAFLSPVGIRSIGIAGASGSLQAGSFGKQIDPLVLALIQAGLEPRGLFWPGTGQYWLFFGNQAIVLTMSGTATQMSWSRYTFPATVDNWTLFNGVLYIRAGDIVWQMDATQVLDDVHSFVGTVTTVLNSQTITVVTDTSGSLSIGDVVVAAGIPAGATITAMAPTNPFTGTGGTGTYQITPAATAAHVAEAMTASGSTLFDGYMSWPYLDFGPIGVEKILEGFDLSGTSTGNVTVTIGYDENTFGTATPPLVVAPDTITGTGMIPYPMTAPSLQFRLDFGSGQNWQWNALNVYIDAVGTK